MVYILCLLDYKRMQSIKKKEKEKGREYKEVAYLFLVVTFVNVFFFCDNLNLIHVFFFFLEIEESTDIC